MQTIKKDTKDFLLAILFIANNAETTLKGKTIYDFHPDFVKAVDCFIEKFEEYLTKRNVPHSLRDDLSRNFGGNVFFSLSGHGCGFWDDSHESGDILNQHLVNFSNNKYRFEHIDISAHRGGKLDLSFLVKFVDSQRNKMFFEGLTT
jgi:hypothetical protein